MRAGISESTRPAAAKEPDRPQIINNRSLAVSLPRPDEFLRLGPETSQTRNDRRTPLTPHARDPGGIWADDRRRLPHELLSSDRDRTRSGLDRAVSDLKPRPHGARAFLVRRDVGDARAPGVLGGEPLPRLHRRPPPCNGDRARWLLRQGVAASDQGHLSERCPATRGDGTPNPSLFASFSGRISAVCGESE